MGKHISRTDRLAARNVRSAVLRSRWVRPALTLIELLIVVACLGVMAAIVQPYFLDAKITAEDCAQRDQLETIRRQIVLYRAQHDGNLPDLITSWNSLTKPHAYRGRTLGPYLAELPGNYKRSNVIDGLKTEAELPIKCGFVYDYRAGAGTGQIWATNGSGRKLQKW